MAGRVRGTGSGRLFAPLPRYGGPLIPGPMALLSVMPSCPAPGPVQILTPVIQGENRMLDRRQILATTSAAGLLAALGTTASAQAPAALNMFIPAAPGGGWDGTGRTIELAMRTDGIVKEFKFENVGGAGGAVGLPRFLARKGQGDTMMVAGMVMVGALIAANSPVKMADATPLARLTDEYLVIVVPAGSPHKTLADLIAAFKADPGKVSWAGGSAGGSDHILAGMLAKAVGVEPKRVTYVAYAGGGPALAALLGSQVTVGISGYSEFAEQIKAGKLRALAVSAPAKMPGVDTPTMKEQGVDVVLGNWRGVFGAPAISADQQKALMGLIERMIAGPTWKAEVEKKGWNQSFLPGAQFAKFIADEQQRIGAILTELDLKRK